jgi:hypothetical protein
MTDTSKVIENLKNLDDQDISSNMKAARDAKNQNITDKRDIREKTSHKQDPTRYGDWEKNGRAIDF